MGLPGIHPVFVVGKIADVEVADGFDGAHQLHTDFEMGHPLSRPGRQVGAQQDASLAGQLGAEPLAVAAEKIRDGFDVFMGYGDA